MSNNFKVALLSLAFSSLSLADEVQNQAPYQVYEVVFNTHGVVQYASYENPDRNNARYRRKLASPTYEFPVKIGDKLNATFEYNPGAAASRFKSGVNYHSDAMSAFHVYSDRFSVSAGFAKEVGVNRYDWHSAYDWSRIDSMLLGSDIPFMSASDINIRLQRPYASVANTPYELESTLSLDYFNFDYGRGFQLWLWFDNRDVKGFESFTEQLVYAQAIELRKLTSDEFVSYCIGNSYSTPACSNENH